MNRSADKRAAGALYIVATPIGNLEDVSARALRVLSEVDIVACEDTRHSARLFSTYSIRTPAISYFEHNEERRTPELIERLLRGENIALVTDAGTPAISDPGYRLVRAAISEGIRVAALPGPSAVIAALSQDSRIRIAQPLQTFATRTGRPAQTHQKDWFAHFRRYRYRCH